MKCRNYIYSTPCASRPTRCLALREDRRLLPVGKGPLSAMLCYGTGAQQATQDYALEASFLRIITTPAIPRLSDNQEDGSW